MSIFEKLDTVGSAPVRASQQATSNNRPQAKLWLNVGYAKGDKFVSLPIGLPIDTMEPVKVSGQAEDWVKLRSAQNDLLKHIQEAGTGLEPGGEVVVNLQLRLRRTNEQLTVAAEDNEYSIDFAGLVG